MIKKGFTKLVFIPLNMIFLILALHGPGFADEAIKFGIAGVFSGQLAPFGVSGMRGVQMAVEDINQKGGVLGRNIELYVEDDYCRPKEAVTKAAKLVHKNVSAIVGHTCSGATLAALEIYSNAKIVVISPSATNPELTRNELYPNFFRTIAPDDAQAEVQVDLAVNLLKLKKFAVLHDKGVYGKGLAEYVKSLLEKSGRAKVVLYAGLPPTSVRYSEVVHKIRKLEIEAVIYSGYHPGALKVLTNIGRMKMDLIFISGDGIKDKSFIAAAGKLAEGVYATAPKDTSANPLAITANDAYVKEYGSEPGPFYLNAYAATLALSNAIEKAGSTDYEAIIKKLQTEFVETPLGRIRFNRHGDAIGVGFSVYMVKNGVFVEQKSP